MGSYFDLGKQEVIQAFLIMSILWKEIEFYEGKSDCEGIVIAAGGLREACVLQASPSR